MDILYEMIQQRARKNSSIEREDILWWAKIFEEPTPEEMELDEMFANSALKVQTVVVSTRIGVDALIGTVPEIDILINNLGISEQCLLRRVPVRGYHLFFGWHRVVMNDSEEPRTATRPIIHN